MVVVALTVHLTVASVFALFALATMVNVWPTAPRPVKLTGETHDDVDAPSSEQVVRLAVVVQANVPLVLVVGFAGCVVTVRLGASCRETDRTVSGRVRAAWRGR